MPPFFGADDLASALCLANQATPTPAALATALRSLYPNDDGPSVADLLATGWVVPTIDKLRLRLPPPSPAELWQRSGATSGLAQLPLANNNGLATTNKLILDKPALSGTLELPPKFSYYQGPITNTAPRAAITVAELHGVIINPPRSLRNRAAAARIEYEQHGKSTAYRALKNGLDYFTVGGIFARRQDAALLTPSHLLVLDFDDMDGEVAKARAALLADEAIAPALALLFISPSGDGLKVVLAADPRHERRRNYERLAQHLTRRYGWGPTLDRKTADISRACFLSHDPTAWIAPSLVVNAAGQTPNFYQNNDTT